MRRNLVQNIFYFIDDLLTIMTTICFKNILRKNTLQNLYSTMKVLVITLVTSTQIFTKVNRHVDVKLFDKNDAFPFSIVRLRFISSNILSNMFYSAITAKILRTGRICSSQQSFYFRLSQIQLKQLIKVQITVSFRKDTSVFSTDLMMSR